MRDDDPIDKGQFQAKFFKEIVNVYHTYTKTNFQLSKFSIPMTINFYH